MDEKELDLEEEIEEADLEEGAEAETSDDDVDFETDEDGNVIIPDDDDKASDENSEEESPEASPSEEKKSEPDPRDEENVRLREALKAYDLQAKDLLKKLGVEEEDTLRGMAQLAAEAEDMPIDEYLKKREEENRAEAERERAEMAKYEEMARADLAELKAAYPELRDYQSLSEMPRDVLVEFARLRDLGLSAKRAYAAANPDGIRSSVVSAVKRQAKNDSKSHLTSSVPKGANGSSKTIPKKELESWMEDLGVSKEEAIRLYKRTM